jgi:hypothetical protein
MQMADDRKPREQASRAQETRYEYTPSSALPDPNPSDTHTYRWVATHVMGALDPMNASKRFRDGWEPCKAADHPEVHIPGNKEGNIEIGGLMLCRMPKEQAQARARYYEKQAEAQMTSVDNNFMRNNDARMPLFTERQSETTRGAGFGKGNSR